jgi:hypothetical protein
MKKMLAIIGFLMVLVGCSNNNKITLNNMWLYDIEFNFRAQQYTIRSQTTRVITDIPNGTYQYGTSITAPDNLQNVSADGNVFNGNLAFQKMNTEVLMLFGYTTEGAGYHVNVNISTNTSSTSSTSASIAGP